MSLQSILYQFLYSVDFQSLLDSPTTFPPLAWQTVVICFNILRPLLKTWKIFTPPNQSAIFLHGNDTKMNKMNKIEYIKKMIEEITTKLDAKWHTSCYVMQPFLPSSNFCSVFYSIYGLEKLIWFLQQAYGTMIISYDKCQPFKTSNLCITSFFGHDGV